MASRPRATWTMLAIARQCTGRRNGPRVRSVGLSLVRQSSGAEPTRLQRTRDVPFRAGYHRVGRVAWVPFMGRQVREHGRGWVTTPRVDPKCPFSLADADWPTHHGDADRIWTSGRACGRPHLPVRHGDRRAGANAMCR
jgi:hypothetical protein